MIRRGLLLLLVLFVPWPRLVAGAPAPGASQPVHAFLDRDQVSLGDTVTLNIQSAGSVPAPDLAPLAKDFQLLGTSSSTSVQIAGGRATRTTQLGIALKPLHAGTLAIPSLDVGGRRTEPLKLEVGPAPVGGTGKVGDPAFVEVHVSSNAPYVGEEVIYTARLFYLPGVDGAWDDPHVDGARLIKLDRDHRYAADRDGYSYQVIERSWALIPGHPGAIAVVGPQFQGQRIPRPGALFNSPGIGPGNPLFNGTLPGFGVAVRATAPQVNLDVRPMPAGATQPWLPARDVRLQLSGWPPNGRVQAGVPVTVTLAIDAVGQPADALPEPRLPPIAGADVYPDQTRDATDDSSQWLQGSRTRSFAIVPRRDGTLRLPEITLAWWDLGADHAQQASVPAQTLRVTGTLAAAPATTSSAVHGPGAVAPGERQATGQTADSRIPWRRVALASLALWLVAIIGLGALWWRRRPTSPGAPDAGSGHSPAPVPDPADAPAPRPAADQRRLQAALLAAARAADAAGCARNLLAWARATHPEVTNAAVLRDALADPAQQDAIAQLQRVRWRGGDPSGACDAIAAAFSRKLAWRVEAPSGGEDGAPLPDLYPGQGGPRDG